MTLIFCRSLTDGCHCERSEAISIVERPEIGTACRAGLAMTIGQIMRDRVLPGICKCRRRDEWQPQAQLGDGLTLYCENPSPKPSVLTMPRFRQSLIALRVGPRDLRFTESGSVYMIVLALSMMVTVIGLASLFAVRVQRRSAIVSKDCAEARLCARSAIELGLYYVSSDSNWRQTWPNGTWLSNQPLGSASFTLEGIDPTDGVLNDMDTEPLVLIGTGVKGLARQKMQVRLMAEAGGLSCLEVALHAGVNISFSNTTVQCNQTVSANDNITASNSTINSDVEAVGLISGSTYNGTNTAGIDPRTMPDANTVFDYYLANGTPISITDIPKSGPARKIRQQLLSPASNPYGAKITNPLGIYVIDCAGERLAISRCRIVGTLVLLNPNSASQIGDCLNWKPAVDNYPALLIKGSMTVGMSDTTLQESVELVNFNPVGTPDDSGVEDTDTLDQYTAVIKGLVYVSAGFDVSSSQNRFEGVLVMGANLTTSTATLYLTYQPTFLNNPPPGFKAPISMKIATASYKQVVD